MLTDLRAINKIIQPMGSLQPGTALPFLLPKEWPIIVIDLKDFFFTICHGLAPYDLLPGPSLSTAAWLSPLLPEHVETVSFSILLGSVAWV